MCPRVCKSVWVCVRAYGHMCESACRLHGNVPGVAAIRRYVSQHHTLVHRLSYSCALHMMRMNSKF